MLEAELEAAQRLAVLGTLAAMIAHEFNNILTPLASYAQHALAHPDDQALTRRALERSIESTDRASRVTEAVLRFARPSGPADGPSHVHGSVKMALACLARSPERDGVRVDVHIPAAASVAMGSIALEQTLVNLILNAKQSIPSSGGSISIDAVESAAPRVPPAAVVACGSTGNDVPAWWTITIRDTGCGMDRTMLESILRPQSHPSARPAPRGTGLGLAICRRFIDRAGGWFWATSNPNKGSTFGLCLPAAPQQNTINLPASADPVKERPAVP